MRRQARININKVECRFLCEQVYSVSTERININKVECRSFTCYNCMPYRSSININKVECRSSQEAPAAVVVASY